MGEYNKNDAMKEIMEHWDEVRDCGTQSQNAHKVVVVV